MKQIFIILFLFLVSSAQASTYTAEKRQKQIQETLGAFQKTDKKNLKELKDYVRFIGKSTCRGHFGGMTLSCVIEQLRSYCENRKTISKEQCAFLSDVIAVNQLNEDRFVTKEEYLAALKKPGEDLLEKKYALLATEFLLLSKNNCSNPDAPECLARRLDDYCLHNSDTKSIPWQACISAVAWYIGTSKE